MYMKREMLWNTQTILKRRIKREEPVCQILRHYVSTVIQIAWYWQKNGNQWNRIENTEIDTCKSAQLMFHKSVNTTEWRKDSLFNKWCWNNGIVINKPTNKKEPRPTFKPYTQINPK